MREALVGLLRCPETRAPLELLEVDAWFEIPDPVAEGAGDPAVRRHVSQGVLRAQGEVPYLYPILDEIPRLVPRKLFSREELDFLATVEARDAREARETRETRDGGRDRQRQLWKPSSHREPEVCTDEELQAEIRRRMEGQYRLDASTPEAVRQRCEGEIRYMTAEAQGTNKQKYVDLLEPHLDQVPSLLEMGGNFPGLTRCLARRYRPGLSVVGNIQILFPMAFKTPGREITAVRADVQALPFAADSFDLVVSGFMLEHVPDWKAGLACMMAVGKRVFLAFGPNKWFPFEVGHIDAPLAGTLPKPLAAYVAWAWLAAVGRRRPLHRVREILGEVFHVGAKAFEREARRLGGRPTNLFPHLVEAIIADQRAPRTGPRKLLKTAPAAARWAARSLAAVGMEPQIYYFIQSPEK